MDMQELITDFPEHLLEAVHLEIIHHFEHASGSIDNVVIIGMGGSGIGGQLACSLLSPVSKVPLLTLSTYDIPAFVSPRTLVIASSFSGNTEETLYALAQAQERGAILAALTSGGQLEELAQMHQCPYVKLPVKAASPRAHLGFSLTALLLLLHRAGIAGKDYSDSIRKVASVLRRQQPHIRERAARAAQFFHQRLPLIYTDQRLLPAAVRLRQQINENAKQLAHVAALPEMNHNELVAWNDPTELLGKARLLLVESDFDHPRTRVRRDILKGLVPEHTDVQHLRLTGEGFLGQMLHFIHWGDWLSYYLAQANEVDPFPVTLIETLKEKLHQKQI